MFPLVLLGGVSASSSDLPTIINVAHDLCSDNIKLAIKTGNKDVNLFVFPVIILRA